MNNSKLNISNLSDFTAFYRNDNSYIELMSSMDELYVSFGKYPKPSHLTCLDGMRSDGQQISQLVLDYDVRSIPEELLKELEFYGYGDDWGTSAEIKYLLPRMLEHIAVSFLHVCIQSSPDNCAFSDMVGHGFFKYKLAEIKIWPVKEQDAVFNFTYNLFALMVDKCSDLSGFIEYICDSNLPLDGERFIKIWDNASKEMKKNQFRNFISAHIQKKPHVIEDVYIGNANITSWIIQDQHLAEFDFFFDDPYYQLVLNTKNKT